MLYRLWSNAKDKPHQARRILGYRLSTLPRDETKGWERVSCHIEQELGLLRLYLFASALDATWFAYGVRAVSRFAGMQALPQVVGDEHCSLLVLRHHPFQIGDPVLVLDYRRGEVISYPLTECLRLGERPKKPK